MVTLVLDVGQTLAGYRLVRELGRGAFGVVWEAVQEETGERVAVKTLLADMSHEDGQRTFARFVAEVQTVRRIQHPNVVTILDAGRGVDRAGRALGFYAMELLAGGTLKQAVAANKKVPALQAVKLVRQAAEGIHAGHALGVVHRDIKPENIMFDGAGRVVVVDFGVCKFAEEQDLTLTGQMVGTVRYMAPEYAADGNIDLRADVFALGALLYFAVVGKHLRAQADLASVFRAISRAEDLERLESADMPEALRRLLRHALAPDPSQRFQSAGALANALQSVSKDLDDEAEVPLIAPVLQGSALSNPSLPPVLGELVDAPLQEAHACLRCKAEFESADDLTAHAVYCEVPDCPARQLPPEAFLPPPDDAEPPLELAYEPAVRADVRCDFCGEWFNNDHALASHWPGCRMRQWHERNFQVQPPANQQARVESPARHDGQGPGLMERMRGWLRRSNSDAADELGVLRRQIEALQDPEAVRLGNKGLDVLGQMLEMLRQGLPAQELRDVVQLRVSETARKLTQLCTSLQFGRQFLVQFPPATVERELAVLRSKGASHDAMARKEALLGDARAVQSALEEHQQRLQGIIDSLGQSAARLHVAMVDPSDKENALVERTLDGLLGDLDALGSAVREMRRLGLG